LRAKLVESRNSNIGEEDWEAADKLLLANAVVSETVDEEVWGDHSAEAQQTATLLLPGTVTADVQRGDRIEFLETTYKVVSHGKKRVSPFTGRIGGTVYLLKNIG